MYNNNNTQNNLFIYSELVKMYSRMWMAMLVYVY